MTASAHNHFFVLLEIMGSETAVQAQARALCVVCCQQGHLERVTRIELASKAWEAAVLPLNYTRNAKLFNSLY